MALSAASVTACASVSPVPQDEQEVVLTGFSREDDRVEVEKRAAKLRVVFSE